MRNPGEVREAHSTLVAAVVATRAAHVCALASLAAAVPERTTVDVVMAQLALTRTATVSCEAGVLAAQVEKGWSEKLVEATAKRAGASRANARAARKRGAAAAVNPGLLAAGLSPDQLDVIAEAASKTDGAAAADNVLVQKVASVSPERGRRITQNWINERATSDGLETEFAKCRRLRRIFLYRTEDGVYGMGTEGDKITIDRCWKEAEARANRMYQNEGGRDVPTAQHARTAQQRMFDAFAEQFLSEGGNARKPVVPLLVVTATLDRLLGITDTPAEILGSGPIPDSVFAELAARSDLAGLIFNPDGHPMHFGRTRRDPTAAQRLAVLIRDKGCVLCDADPHRCEIHHTMPWNAPGKGSTDVEMLAAVCGVDHRQLHKEKQTLVQRPDGSWTTRPATRDEIAPTRPERK